jgi:tRNA (guanosine-2'-O-)-methyltransferase
MIFLQSFFMTEQRQQRIEHVLKHRQPNITLVFENVFDPHNISAVMRTADAIGIQEIYIVQTKLPTRKKFGNKTSSSANKWLTIHQFTNIETCFEEVRKKYKNIYSTYLNSESKSVYEIDFTQSIALVFGNEHEGVTPQTNDLCDGNFIIPQVGMIQSLNISVACAVTLYEAFRQKQLAGHYNQVSLPEQEYNQLFKKWSINE